MKQIVAVAILDSLTAPTRLLAARRTYPEHLAGQWEFPGGKVEPGEELVQAVHREVREELGVDVTLGEELAGPIAMGWPLHETAAMRVWFAVVNDGVPEPIEGHDELRWLPLDADLAEQVPWIPADAPIVAALLERVAGRLPG